MSLKSHQELFRTLCNSLEIEVSTYRLRIFLWFLSYLIPLKIQGVITSILIRSLVLVKKDSFSLVFHEKTDSPLCDNKPCEQITDLLQVTADFCES